ncbi:50S ribosomal protein L31e [Candidatus Altiarchaeota archaeon]
MAEETKKPAKKKSKKQKEIPPEEKTYYIPLRKTQKKPRAKRAANAMSQVKTYLQKKAGLEEYHMDPSVNEKIWAKGAEKPPKGIKIKVTKTPDEITVTPLD